MDKESVVQTLKSLGASDIGTGMQVMETDPGKLKNWMWHLEEYNFTLETLYSKGKLVTLNYWNWEGRKLSSYHHLMEYHEISELRADTRTKKHFTKLIKKYNFKK